MLWPTTSVRIPVPERSVEHDTIVVERRYAASPQRVYQAWVEPEGRDRWDVPGHGWEYVTEERDVRPGGRDVIRFGPPGALDFRGDTTYVDLVEDERIVCTYTVTELEVLLSVSLLTVEVHPDGAGTQMVVTEQVAFLGGRDTPAARLAGLDEMFDGLARHLGEEPT